MSDRSTDESTPARARQILITTWPLLAAAAILIALYPLSFASMVRIWSESATYGHGFLVPLIAGYMIWARRARLRGLTLGFSPLGVPVALAGVGAWYVGVIADANVVIHAALIVLIHAGVLLAGGLALYWRLAFPLAFLFLAVPFGEFAVPPLQDLTADWTVLLLQLTGIPVYQEGWLIHIPGGVFRVAEVCAGLRYVLAAIALSLLVADVFLRRWWHYALMGLVAGILVPVLANVVRAYGIIILAYVSDFKIAMGVDHLIYGWLFFSLISLIIVLVGAIAGRRLSPTTAAPTTAGARPTVGRGAVVGVTVLLGIALAGHAVTGFRAEAIASVRAPASLPHPAGWEAVDTAQWSPNFAGPGVTGAWRLSDGKVDVPVRLDVALWARERPGKEAVSVRNDIDGGADRVNRTQMQMAGRGQPNAMMLHHVRTRAGERLIAWTYWVDGRFVATAWEAKLWQAKVRLLGGQPLSGIVALSTRITDDGDAAKARIGQALATSDLQAFLGSAAANARDR